MTTRSLQRNVQLGIQGSTTLVNQTLQWIVLTYQAIAVVLFLVGLFLASHWLQQPFIGAFYEHTMPYGDKD